MEKVEFVIIENKVDYKFSRDDHEYHVIEGCDFVKYAADIISIDKKKGIVTLDTEKYKLSDESRRILRSYYTVHKRSKNRICKMNFTNSEVKLFIPETSALDYKRMMNLKNFKDYYAYGSFKLMLRVRRILNTYEAEFFFFSNQFDIYSKK